MIDPATAGTIVGMGKSAIEVALGLSKLKTSAEVNAKAVELTQIILALQEAAFSVKVERDALEKKVGEFEREIVRLKECHEDLERYKLFEPWTGTVVYALRQSVSNGEPPHYICTNCYAQPKKSILQRGESNDGWSLFRCPACRSEAMTPYRGSVAAKYPPE